MGAPKTKGRLAEHAVVQYLREHGFPYAERRALRGTQDAGDIAGIPGFVIEVKNHKALALAAWMNQAQVEAVNATLPPSKGVVWHKRVGTVDPGEWYVTMTGELFAELIRDEVVAAP